MSVKNLLGSRLEFYENWNNAPSKNLLWALMCKWVRHFWCLRPKNDQFIRSDFIKTQSLELKLFMVDISSWFILSFSFLSSLLTTLTQVTGEQCSCCVFISVSMRGYVYHLIQPWATSVACRLSVSSLTLMSSHNLFVSLHKLPCCPHNVRQSIIMWPTYLPRLPTALVIHPLACTVPISDLPLSLEKKPLVLCPAHFHQHGMSSDYNNLCLLPQQHAAPLKPKKTLEWK